MPVNSFDDYPMTWRPSLRRTGEEPLYREIAGQLEADIRKNFDKLLSNQARIAAKAAGRAVDVSADDFNDEN